jgi:hypothetical protein
MAVTTTPQDLMEWAYSKSTKNNPGAIATESTELFQLVIRMVRKFFSIAARVNPLYFAGSEEVAAPGADTGWERPEGAESIFQVEFHGLGRIASQSFSGVGNGVLTISAVGDDLKAGTYTLICTAESSNAGTFKLTDPDGTIVEASITVAAVSPTVTTHMTVAIADGSEDFDVDDTFSVVVSGKNVVVVPFDDLTCESGLPALYRMGKTFYTAGNTLDPDPATDALTFWFSRRPDDPSSYTATIDDQWEEAYNELIVLEIAAYLAHKDDRQGELQLLVKDRDEWLRLFIMFLEHETSNERRRYGHLRRFNTQSLVPISDLLVGGSTVKLERGSA